jgi:hypothetical protein
MHEDLEEEALALCGAARSSYLHIIYWRDFILEEGAWVY